MCVRIHAANGLLIKDFSGEARKSRRGNGVEGQVRRDGRNRLSNEERRWWGGTNLKEGQREKKGICLFDSVRGNMEREEKRRGRRQRD